MSVDRFAIVDEPIDVNALTACVSVEAYGGVQDSWSVCCVDFQRSQVGGDAAPCPEFQEVRGNRNCQRSAFFGIGGRA